MRQIYNGARMVPIWLGEEDDQTTYGYHLIRGMNAMIA